MATFYDTDIDLELIQNKRIAIVGFGAQGRSHALNLQDADMDAPLIVCCYHGNSSQPASQYFVEQGFDHRLYLSLSYC